MNQVFEVKVKPNARENKILAKENKTIRVAIAAPAKDGKANKELIKFLSKELKSRVEIIKGKSSSKKLVRIEHAFL